MVTWNEAAEQFSKVTDKLGKPIDQGIFELVVCLNLLEIPTRQSCEGHLGWGLPYPWVDIEPEKEIRFQCYQLVSQFYNSEVVSSECVLVFHGYRLQSAAAVVACMLSSEEQASRLRCYQAEMAHFTRFLKTLTQK